MRKKMVAIPSGILGANPSALHREGVALRRIVEDARQSIAETLDVHADEIIFTSGATESDNLAIAGTLNRWIDEEIDPNDILVFSSDLEHAAVAETIERFTRSGVQHNIFPTEEGLVIPKHLIIPDHAKAVLVSVMYVSNEIGTVQPLADIAKRIRKLRKERPDVQFVFHTDATQAPLYYSLRVPALGIDLMTLGATKLYCTKGVGVLYKKRVLKLIPLMGGGGQERGVRPGTEPVSLIHEFSHALLYAQKMREEETKRMQVLQKYFESEIGLRFSQAKITAKGAPRSPHISHIAFPAFDSELLVLELDARGIAVSAKSACKNEEDSESVVVEKMYGKGYGAVRFSFGRTTQKKHLDRAIAALGLIFRKYQRIP